MDTSWFKNAIIYGVDVARFKDSNGDGIGDFPGLTDQLDYLAKLGVTCLWLLPFYPSPNRDNRYDVSDYFDVAPELGTLDDFVTCLHRAGEHGMHVILDLIVNHTSDQHPWFQAARRDPESRYRNYYTWTESPVAPAPDEGPIFPDQESTVWTYDEVAHAYYHHRFYHFQPDLDAANPEVREEIKRILDFWLSFGISGFRIDAASHMITTEVPEHPAGDPHEILRDIRAYITSRNPDAILLGEVDEEPEKLSSYFGNGDQLTLLFNFVLNNFLFLALAQEKVAPILQVLQQLPAIPDACQWANFLRNLDELDLERLRDAEREQVLEAFAPDEEMRIFGRGIRRRIAPMLEGNRQRLELAYSLLFALPGAPVLIYGDEIGMGEDLSQEGRAAVRTPMQWSDKKNAGFSTARKSDLILPVVADGPFDYHAVNVAAQRDDPDSFFNWMKRLIFTRRACPEIGSGNWHLIATDEPSVLAHRCAWKDGIVITVHNLAPSEMHVELDLQDQQGRDLVPLLNDGPSQSLAEGSLSIDVEPYGYRWYRIEGERHTAGTQPASADG